MAIACPLHTNNRGSFSIYTNACPQILSPRILPEWVIRFWTKCYHTKATFTVWAPWLASDLKAAILNMNGADSLMFVFLQLVIKIIYFQVFEYIRRDIKHAENVCDSHSFPVYNILSPCQHDMMLLFLKKPNSALIRRIHVLPEHTMPERVNIFLPEVQVQSN